MKKNYWIEGYAVDKLPKGAVCIGVQGGYVSAEKGIIRHDDTVRGVPRTLYHVHMVNGSNIKYYEGSWYKFGLHYVYEVR